MATTPTKVYINNGGTPAEWVQAHMSDGTVADDGTFMIDSPEGLTKVERAFAVFEYDGQAYACNVRQVQEKLKQIAGDHPTVAALPDPRPHKSASVEPRSIVPGKKPLKFKPMIGEPAVLHNATLAPLTVDETYQRSVEGGVSRKQILDMAVNWDWRLCMPLLISRRAGTLFVIDGQHRLEAARLRGDITYLPAVIFEFDDQRGEAELFLNANRKRRQVSKLDDFHAAVAAGDEKATAIRDVVAAAGLVVGRNTAWQMLKPGEVVFVSALAKAMRTTGGEIATHALTAIAQAFPGEVLNGAAPIFEGLCTMIAEGKEHGAPIDMELMQIVLAETGLDGWKEAFEDADSGYDRADAMLKALRNAYAEAGAE
jgi:hypothetical protein